MSRRPQTCEAFSDSLDANDGTFLTLAKLVCRIWARTILCVCITVVLLGLIAAGAFLWRRGDMRDHYEREQQAYAGTSPEKVARRSVISPTPSISSNVR